MATSAYCACGFLLRWGEIPNVIEWLHISDVNVAALPRRPFFDRLLHVTNRAIRCPNCLRLWIRCGGASEAPEELLPRALVERLYGAPLPPERQLRAGERDDGAAREAPATNSGTEEQ